MKSPAHTRKNGAPADEGKITMDDIRAHLARFGRDGPCVLPLTSGIEEAPRKEEMPATEKPKETPSSGIGPLDTRGLSQALIHRPWDVNSPY